MISFLQICVNFEMGGLLARLPASGRAVGIARVCVLGLRHGALLAALLLILLAPPPTAAQGPSPTSSGAVFNLTRSTWLSWQPVYTSAISTGRSLSRVGVFLDVVRNATLLDLPRAALDQLFADASTHFSLYANPCDDALVSNGNITVFAANNTGSYITIPGQSETDFQYTIGGLYGAHIQCIISLITQAGVGRALSVMERYYYMAKNTVGLAQISTLLARTSLLIASMEHQAQTYPAMSDLISELSILYNQLQTVLSIYQIRVFTLEATLLAVDSSDRVNYPPLEAHVGYAVPGLGFSGLHNIGEPWFSVVIRDASIWDAISTRITQRIPSITSLLNQLPANNPDVLTHAQSVVSGRAQYTVVSARWSSPLYSKRDQAERISTSALVNLSLNASWVLPEESTEFIIKGGLVTPIVSGSKNHFFIASKGVLDVDLSLAIDASGVSIPTNITISTCLNPTFVFPDPSAHVCEAFASSVHTLTQPAKQAVRYQGLVSVGSHPSSVAVLIGMTRESIGIDSFVLRIERIA